MTKLRLLKVVVTPVFVLDDGENLHEEVGKQFSVGPNELMTFPEKFIADMDKAQAAIDAQVAGGADDKSD